MIDGFKVHEKNPFKLVGLNLKRKKLIEEDKYCRPCRYEKTILNTYLKMSLNFEELEEKMLKVEGMSEAEIFKYYLNIEADKREKLRLEKKQAKMLKSIKAKRNDKYLCCMHCGEIFLNPHRRYRECFCSEECNKAFKKLSIIKYRNKINDFFTYKNMEEVLSVHENI